MVNYPTQQLASKLAASQPAGGGGGGGGGYGGAPPQQGGYPQQLQPGQKPGAYVSRSD